MTDTVATAPAQPAREKTIFDGWRSVTISLYMALLGYAVMVGIPVISSAWVELLGFTEVQVGRVAGADLGGLTLGSIIASAMIARKMNRRMISVLGVVLAVAGNGLCMIYTTYELTLWLRVIAGIGSGIYTATAIANLGATARPARTINLLLFAFAFTQAAEMQVLPQLSMNGIYGLFIVLYLISLLFIKWVVPYAVSDDKVVTDMDVTHEVGGRAEPKFHVPDYVPWMVLLAVLVSYITIGAYWTYIELANIDAGVDPDWISSVLVWGSFMSMIGCLVATVISDRVGLARPLIGALLTMCVCVGLMIGEITAIDLLISVCLFNFLWLFIDVYQMGSMGNFDQTGKYVSLVPAAQGLGQIIGPNAAASVLDFGLGYNGVFTMCAIVSFTAMVIYAGIYLRMRKTTPELADMS